MKKIIIVAITFFVSATVKAQLASDTPAMTREQVAALKKQETAKPATPVVSTTSSKPVEPITKEKHPVIKVQAPSQGEAKEVPAKPASESKTPSAPGKDEAKKE